MSDGKVIYHVRADHSKVDEDMRAANSKVKSGAEGFSKTMKTMITGAAVAAVAKEVVQLGSAFETSLAGASTLFGDVNVDMNRLSDDMLKLSNSTGVAADELGNSLYNALSAGIPVTKDMSEAMGFLEKSSQLAKAGFTDVDSAMSATVKTLNAYGMGVEETDRIQKILMQTQNNGIVTVGELSGVLAQVTPTAAAMGVSFEQVGAAISGMTAQGTPAAQATTQLNALFSELGKSGTKASNGLAEATKGTEYAGMSFQDMMDAGVPLNEVLNLMGDYAAENGLGMLDMFSSIEAGKAALANGGENSQMFTDNLAAMSTQTDVVGDAFDKVTETSAEKFNKAINELKNSAIDLFLEMVPLISEILPVFSDLIKMLLPPLIELVSAILPVLVEIFKALAPPILDIIDKVLPPLIDLLKSLGDFISVVLVPIIRFIGAIFADVFGSIAKSVSKDIQSVTGVLSGIISFVKNVFTGNWRGVWKSIKDIFSSYISGLANIFKSPLNAIIDGLNSFIKGANKIKIPEWVPGVGGKGINLPTIPRLRVGLDYVPDDEYPAMLHRGEAVLTAREADLYRSLGGNLDSFLQSLGQMSSKSDFQVPELMKIMSANSDLLNRVDRILGIMSIHLPKIGVPYEVYLDTGVLAGEMAPKINSELGKNASLKERGR